MQASNRILTGFVLIGCGLIGSCQATHEPASGFEDLVAAERAFSAASGTRGIRDAFLTFLGAESIVFRPGPVNGQQAYQQSPPSRGSLHWYPERAELAASGTLGYTTGPYEYRDEQGASFFGHYVSVWTLQNDGTWRVALDVGTGHDRLEGFGNDVDVRNSGSATNGTTPGGTNESRTQRLNEREHELIVARKISGAAESYRKFGADDFTIYRDGTPPTEDATEFDALLADRQDIVSHELVGVSVADRGELGYTYGTLQVQTDDGIQSRCFARIWRYEGASGYRLVIDVETHGSLGD